MGQNNMTSLEPDKFKRPYSTLWRCHFQGDIHIRHRLPHYTLGCSLFLKSDLNFMDIKSCELFTELGGLVVESLVFYIGKNTPRPTYLRGKMID